MKFTFRYATGDTQCRHIFCHVTLICSIRTASAYEVIFLSENGRLVSNDNMIECQVLVVWICNIVLWKDILCKTLYF